MITLRKIFFAFLCLSFSFFQSCDPCASIICNHGGTCVNGSCICTAGYEGPDCSIESRNKFLGTYEVRSSHFSSNGQITLQTYTCEISAGINPNEIIITPLFTGIEETVECTVNGNEFNIYHASVNNVIGNSNNYNANGSLTIPKFSMYYRNLANPGSGDEDIAIGADFYPL